MKIALIHYHLKTGGVAAVIRDQIEAIVSLGGEALVLAGAPSPESYPAQAVFIEALAYDNEIKGEYHPRDIAEAVLGALSSYWPEGADLIHVHNPTLAKNRYLQNALKILQGKGQRLLCQIHDFAEDGRPEAYYPGAYVQDCHYATVNPRDHRLLIESGLTPAGCHFLPNAVTFSPKPVAKVTVDAPVLYPVRAIRRKNIGEAILLSLFFNGSDRLAITLPPNSPADLTHYERWQALVERHHLPVRFEVGSQRGFSELMSACRYVVTTSITEGFGFAFLEPWIAGKCLLGRILPDICSGFVQNGLRLDHLYHHLKIPLEWTDQKGLAGKWQSTLASAAERFGVSLSTGDIDEGWRAVTSGGWIDFGLLDESFQQPIIIRLLDETNARKKLISKNTFLKISRRLSTRQTLIAHNREVVRGCYNRRQYARWLQAVYRAVVQTPVRHQIDKPSIAKAFLNPERFSLLKWGKASG